MATIKIASWNVEYLDRLLVANPSESIKKRRDAVAKEIMQISADVLCLLEAPKGEQAIDKVSTDLLGGEWIPVKASDGIYDIQGIQWIWFLVRKELANKASLLPTKTWDSFAGGSWKYHLWGEFKEEKHQHYRHPQVLVLDRNGFRVEFIGIHLKSKFINQGESKWKKGGSDRENFIREALTARIKMTTEAINVRSYIDAKFNQVANPAIFVMGDFNDGPGKEYFEEYFLFFDLISNIQGDVFFSRKFLNHALFDFPDELKWTVYFKDFVDPERDPKILLDHILFTQGLVDGSLPWKINEHAGKVEHEIHDLINATLPKKAITSDHKPLSLIVNIDTDGN
jgi:hypothetical protein